VNPITGLTFPISAQLQYYFLTNFFIYTCTFSFALFVPSLFLAMGDFCSSAAIRTAKMASQMQGEVLLPCRVPSSIQSTMLEKWSSVMPSAVRIKLILHIMEDCRGRKRKLQEDTEEHEGDSKALNGWMDGTMMMHWPSWDDGVAGIQEIVI
jgi:hypothetical protein